jgi:GrpB-like predicted nucleotidyltransferase (UPF0157 family)
MGRRASFRAAQKVEDGAVANTDEHGRGNFSAAAWRLAISAGLCIIQVEHMF